MDKCFKSQASTVTTMCSVVNCCTWETTGANVGSSFVWVCNNTVQWTLIIGTLNEWKQENRTEIYLWTKLFPKKIEITKNFAKAFARWLGERKQLQPCQWPAFNSCNLRDGRKGLSIVILWLHTHIHIHTLNYF